MLFRSTLPTRRSPQTVCALSPTRASRKGGRTKILHNAAESCNSNRKGGQLMRLILLKNPFGQKATVKRTMSDVSLGHSNRVQTKLARKNFQHFSYIFTHLQNRGVLQQNRDCHILSRHWSVGPDSPDTHRTLAGDNFRTPRSAASLRRAS